MSEVGREIRRLRQAKGWTQGQLAVYAGSSQPTVNLIETGKRNPSAMTLQKLARALEVEVADLFPKGQSPLPLDVEEQAAATVTSLPQSGERTDYREMYREATRQLVELSREVLNEVNKVMGTWDWDEFQQLPADEQNLRVKYAERLLDIAKGIHKELHEPHEDLEQQRHQLEARIAEFRKSA